MTISTNQKPTIYRNLYENTGPGLIINQEALAGGELYLPYSTRIRLHRRRQRSIVICFLNSSNAMNSGFLYLTEPLHTTGKFFSPHFDLQIIIKSGNDLNNF